MNKNMPNPISNSFSMPNSNNQTFYLTLPIACQICLGKVKDPCVCPNFHVFCEFCIEIWLEKSKQCPTCRISRIFSKLISFKFFEFFYQFK